MTAKRISIKGTGCKFRRLRAEGGRAYLGRTVVCPGILESSRPTAPGRRLQVITETPSGALPAGVNVNYFGWSPDAKRLAFTMISGAAGSDVWVMAASGGDRMRFTLTGHAEAFLWSPDGKYIVYSDRPSSP